ncbi:uncharacterized protein LOC119068552 [Bradysia coprophila]|uniref:uncharacterized protein LOC119068552 n=1 Tax=Bradysia coprophila TaxID=38358 RepID=UPI00187D7161|nr:uncharacterized protein LOC119068552 [Bradysia coprophila]
MKFSFFFALFLVFHFSNGFALSPEILARFNEIRDSIMETLTEMKEKIAQSFSNKDSKSVENAANATDPDSDDGMGPIPDFIKTVQEAVEPAVEAFENASANATQAIADTFSPKSCDGEEDAQGLPDYIEPFAEAFDASANATQAAADAAKEVAAGFVEQASTYFV